MESRFVKLTTKTEEIYINPHMITCIRKYKESNDTVIHLFDQRSIRPDETFQEIMKKIKDSQMIKFDIK
jgi:predicted nucleic acid-binding OB-fold protein